MNRLSPARWVSERLSHPVIGNAVRILAARIATAMGQMVLLALVGRLYGVHDLAGFVVAFAASGLAATAVDSGSGLWAAREIAATGARAKVLLAKIPLLLFAWTILLAIAWLGVLDGAHLPGVLVLSTGLASAKYLRGVLWGGGMYGREALTAVVETWSGVAAVAIGALALVDADAVLLYGAATCAGAFMRLILSRRLRPDKQLSLLGLFRRSWSYTGQSFVASGQAQIDTLILAAFLTKGSPELAAYGVAMRFYYAVGMPMEAVGGAILTHFARKYDTNSKQIRRAWVVLTPISMGALATLIGLAYIEMFGEGIADEIVLVGAVLLIGVPCRGASYLYGNAVTAIGEQPRRFVASVMGLVAMIIADFLLIPPFGATGAAAALVLSDAVLALGYLRIFSAAVVRHQAIS